MKQITLSGMQYIAVSPSLFHQVGYPVSIGFDGIAWRIHIAGQWAMRELDSREAAADIISQAFGSAMDNLA